MPTERNARWWDWVNDGWVKLTLRPGQSLSHQSGGPTDEGYSWSSETWEYDGRQVRNSFLATGRDCDGRHESGGACVAALGQLAVEFRPLDWDRPDGDGVMVPHWEREDRYQRDYSAEAAGY